MGFVGGATGQMLERGLSDLGIATDFVHIVGETRTNVVITDANAERHVKVNEVGPKVRADEVAAFLDRARERVRPGDIWVLSGSLPPGVPPDFYAQFIALVQAGGAKALLDSSGEPLRLGYVTGPYLVKPNAVEAEEVMGREISSTPTRSMLRSFSCARGSSWWRCRWVPRACCWSRSSVRCGPGRPACGRGTLSARGTRCWLASPGRWSEGYLWRRWPAGGWPPARQPPCTRESALARKPKWRRCMSRYD